MPKTFVTVLYIHQKKGTSMVCCYSLVRGRYCCGGYWLCTCYAICLPFLDARLSMHHSRHPAVCCTRLCIRPKCTPRISSVEYRVTTPRALTPLLYSIQLLIKFIKSPPCGPHKLINFCQGMFIYIIINSPERANMDQSWHCD